MYRRSLKRTDPQHVFQQLHDRRYGTAAAWLPTRLLAPALPVPRPRPIPPPPGSVVLGRDATTHAPVFVAAEQRTKGLYLVGIQGMGKSSLMEELIVQDMRNGSGVCVLDPHHYLIDHCLGRVPSGRQDDVVLLDLRETTRPFGINPFDCAAPHDPQAIAETRQRVMRIFQRLWGPEGENPSWGIQIEELLGMATATFIENPGMTLAELPDLFENAAFRTALLANVTNPDVRRFWLGRYATMSEREQRSYTDSTRRRVQEFLIDPIVKHIVAQPHTTFDIPAIMARGQILFVALNPMLKELTALVGATILELVGDAAFNRPVGERPPYFVYADECQRFTTTNLHELIPQIRKFGVAIALAHQFRGQFPRSHPMHEASTAMGSFVILRTKPEDARELAEHFDTTPDQPRQVPLDPLGELERRGHPNDAVVRTVRELRSLLAGERGDVERRVAYDREAYRDARRFGSSQPVDLPVSATTELGQLRESINDYLASTLEGQQPEAVPLANPRLRAVVERLGDLLAAAPEALFVHAADQRGSRGEKRAQVENALKHLPRYRAYAKVLRALGDDEVSTEHVLLTPHFHPGDERPTAKARVAALRERSVARYGTPVAQIEAAMAARQASGSDEDGGPAGAPAPARPHGPRPTAPAAPQRPRAGRRAALVQEAVIADEEE